MDVFISYQHESKDIADSVVSYLESKGLMCWYAPRNIVGAYAEAIVKAIGECKVFILILDQKASESVQVLNEIEMAYERVARGEIAIIPFKIEKEEHFSKTMLYYIKRLHWVSGIDMDTGVKTLFAAIDDYLNQKDIELVKEELPKDSACIEEYLKELLLGILLALNLLQKKVMRARRRLLAFVIIGEPVLIKITRKHIIG